MAIKRLALDPVDALLIDRLQDGIPIVAEPFAALAREAALADRGLDASAIIERIERLLSEGVLTRFGPMYRIERAGGWFTLAALRVPKEDFERVNAIVNALPEVAHNYERTHEWNMWFVLAAASRDEAIKAIARIEQATGLPVLDLPKEREFRIHLRFRAQADDGSDVRADAGAGAGAVPARIAESTAAKNTAAMSTAAWHDAPGHVLDDLDRRLIGRTQAGLPLRPRPFEGLLDGVSEVEVINRLDAMLASGVLRRIAAAPDHWRLGYRFNGMTVWDVADTEVDRIGARIAALGLASHCYRRPRRLPGWRYNLFAMVHARTLDQAQGQVDAIARIMGNDAAAHETLYSTRILKKTGMRLPGA